MSASKEPLTLLRLGGRVEQVLNRPTGKVHSYVSLNGSSSSSSTFFSSLSSSSTLDSSNNSSVKIKKKKRMRSIRNTSASSSSSRANQNQNKNTGSKLTYTFLNKLIKPEKLQSGRFVFPLPFQLIGALLVHALAGFFAFEPLLPEGWAAVTLTLEEHFQQLLTTPVFSKSDTAAKYFFTSSFNTQNSNTSSQLGNRLALIFQGSIYSVLWLLGLELWKVNLRTLNDLHNSSTVEVSLSEQINRNNRIKSAERLHSLCFSQFVLVLVSQLYLAFELDPSSSLLLRLVVAFNLLFTISRLVDIIYPRRLRIFSTLVVYVPVMLTCGIFLHRTILHRMLLKLADLCSVQDYHHHQ